MHRMREVAQDKAWHYVFTKNVVFVLSMYLFNARNSPHTKHVHISRIWGKVRRPKPNKAAKKDRICTWFYRVVQPKLPRFVTRQRIKAAYFKEGSRHPDAP